MSLWKAITDTLVPIHRAGHAIIAVFAAVTVVFLFVFTPLGWFAAVLTLWSVYFFRDPERSTPTRGGLVIASADGVVASVELASPPPELDMGNVPRMRIGTFMNVFNVHVNRTPAGGIVTRAVYTPGLFLNATLDKSSEHNERMALRMKTDTGKDIAFVQIAGLIARRIVCEVEEGQIMKVGQRFGIIRFGSRVDVYLDEGMVPLVVAGQTMIAGETVIADEESCEDQRRAEVR